MAVFAGWLANQTTPVYLVLDETSDVETAVLSLARLGVDAVEGVLAGGFEAWRDAGQPITMSQTIAPRELADARDDYVVLDVRDDIEFEDEGHIPGARHFYVGYVEHHLSKLKPELHSKAPIAVVCSVGHRAGLATSILIRNGYKNVCNVLGGMTAWKKLELELTKSGENSVTTPDIEGKRE
jgi:hydroxyacylglutathione hydrolase